METKTITTNYNLFQETEENAELSEINDSSDTDLSNIQDRSTSRMSSIPALTRSTTKRQKIPQEKEFFNIATKTLANYNSSNNHNLPTHIDDKFDAMGKKMAFDLRSLSPDQLIFAEKLMSDDIYYAKLNRLNEAAVVSIKQSHGFNTSQHQTTNNGQYFTNNSSSNTAITRTYANLEAINNTSTFQLHNTTEPQQFQGLNEFLNFNKQ